MITNLVIGSDGFVGTPFCRHLEELGERVIRFDLKRGGQEDARTARLDLEKTAQRCRQQDDRWLRR